jgi:WxcM-like, C-terminal
MLKVLSDSRGSLGSIEFADLPFVPRRFYWVMMVKNEIRGRHAHRNLEQIVFVQSGTIKFHLINGHTEAVRVLHEGEYLHLGNLIWREFECVGENAILGCLASQPYSEDDYIRDFEVYLETFNEIL